MALIVAALLVMQALTLIAAQTASERADSAATAAYMAADDSREAASSAYSALDAINKLDRR